MVGNFDISLLQLGNGYLLLNKLQEKLLLVSDSLARLEDFLLSLAQDTLRQSEESLLSLLLGRALILLSSLLNLRVQTARHLGLESRVISRVEGCLSLGDVVLAAFRPLETVV